MLCWSKDRAPSPVNGSGDAQLLVLSARSESALQALVNRYIARIEADGGLSLTDVCFTASTGRCHFDHRLALVADSMAELRQHLSTADASTTEPGIYRGQTQPNLGAIAFLFPGQGSQTLGMGLNLYDSEPLFRRTLDACAELIDPLWEQYSDQSGVAPSLLEVLHGATNEDDLTLLNQTAFTQPALFAVEYALAKLWRSWGIEPGLVMGHSVGEYVAACVAGVFTLEEALQLIVARARLMQALPSGGEMWAVMASENMVEQTIKSLKPELAEMVAIAAINGPESVVISGQQDAVAALCQRLQDQHCRTTQLRVSHAFHSPLMAPMLDEFKAVAHQIDFASPQIPVISNVTGQVSEAVASAAYWCDHIRQPVQFAQSMDTLAQTDINVLLEVGPQPTLLGMGRGCLPSHSGLWLPSLRRPGPETGSEIEQIRHSLAQLYVHGVAIDWSQVYANSPLTHYQRLSLPTYPFERRRHWAEPTGQPGSIRAIAQRHSGRSIATGTHPLLGPRLRLAACDEIRFQSELDRLPLGEQQRVARSSTLGIAVELALGGGGPTVPAHCCWHQTAID